ncbi:MAG: ABC transporter ATP-binding protein [Candidatus Marinimicrobia bacterium]|nr:ABC transporter ATP-binding protein [Candidatus Neomarinimicrobiota bacterium]
MLKINNLTVEIENQKILKNINIDIKTGEIVALFGPNGSGKTTLLMALMGYDKYDITEGKIFFKGKDITNLSIDERVKMGIGMMFQRPPVVKGVTVNDLINLAGDVETDYSQLSNQLNADAFLNRYLNDGFSGGEIKRSELLQLISLQPDLLLLDEPESGVDVENVELIGRTINDLLHENLIIEKNGLTQKQRHEKRKRSGFIITHTGHILEYVNADRAIVFIDGHIVCKGNPGEVLNMIKENGFEECKKCDQRV